MFFWRPFLLVAALSQAAAALKLTIDDDDENSAATPGGLLHVTMEGLTQAPECTFETADGEFLIQLGGKDILYEVTETQPHSWYGKEKTEFGEYVFLYIDSDPAVPGTCFITGTVGSTEVGVRIVLKTTQDGSMWASVLTADDLKDVVYGEPEEVAASLPLDQLLPQGRQQENDVVDMLVVATREAVCGVAEQEPDCSINDATLVPIRMRIDFLMFQLNQFLANSEIDLVVRRVGPYTFDQGDFQEIDNGRLYRSVEPLRDMLSCSLGNICELRNEFCADIVHLVTFNRAFFGVVGQASAIGPNPQFWSVFTSLAGTAASRAVFTHETGHMLVRSFAVCLCLSVLFNWLFAQRAVTLCRVDVIRMILMVLQISLTTGPFFLQMKTMLQLCCRGPSVLIQAPALLSRSFPRPVLTQRMEEPLEML